MLYMFNFLSFSFFPSCNLEINGINKKYYNYEL